MLWGRTEARRKPEACLSTFYPRTITGWNTARAIHATNTSMHVRLTLATLALFGWPPAAPAAPFHRLNAPAPRGSAITLRKRLHVNTLITAPGTLELEWGNDYSLTSDDDTIPATLKYTPEGRHILWGRTEFAASFDTISTSVENDARIAHFSDRITCAATSVLFDGEKLDVAIAPQASVFLRGESGMRMGATAIARYDSGRNSTGVTLSWTGATVSSPDNPAATFDAGFGYGRRLKASGFLGHFSPHGNVIYEKSTGLDRLLSVFEGVEYQVTDNFAIDATAQHFNVVGGAIDHQVVIGITWNLGRIAHSRSPTRQQRDRAEPR